MSEVILLVPNRDEMIKTTKRLEKRLRGVIDIIYNMEGGYRCEIKSKYTTICIVTKLYMDTAAWTLHLSNWKRRMDYTIGEFTDSQKSYFRKDGKPGEDNIMLCSDEKLLDIFIKDEKVGNPRKRYEEANLTMTQYIMESKFIPKEVLDEAAEAYTEWKKYDYLYNNPLLKIQERYDKLNEDLLRELRLLKDCHRVDEILIHTARLNSVVYQMGSCQKELIELRKED